MYFASLLGSIRSRRGLRVRGGSWGSRALVCVALLAPSALVACNDRAVGPNELPEPGDDPSVSFSTTGTLELLPAEVRAIEVVTEPNANVKLLLLGDAFDASLDAAEITADAQGRAEVELRAPTQPAAFVLRAQVGNKAYAELHVAVSEFGFATVRVVPSYEGNRELAEWSADILVGQTCDVALASYPEDPVGALHGEAASDAKPIITSVPVGPALAVAVRSGSLAAGCVSFTAQKPDSTEEVVVTVLDRPMLLDGVELAVSLDFTPTGESYGPLLERSIEDLTEVAFPSEIDFATLLLDAMEGELDTAAAESVAELRDQAQLDENVSLVLAGYHAHDTCLELAPSAKSFALADAQSNTSRIEGIIKSDEGSFTPRFELDTFSGLSPAEVGAPETVAFSWSATADDVLVISGILPVSSTRLAGAFMNSALSAQIGEPTPVPVAIATLADCSQIATVIAGGGVDGCDAACLEDACLAAITSRWAIGLAAGDSIDGSGGSIAVSIGGDAKVDSTLAPTSFVGSWLGTLSHVALGSGEELESAIAGAASGELPPPP